jgi:hypothetical protein
LTALHIGSAYTSDHFIRQINTCGARIFSIPDSRPSLRQNVNSELWGIVPIAGPSP